MASTISNLIEMGFSKEKVQLAISKCGTDDIFTLTDWLLSFGDELDGLEPSESNSDNQISNENENNEFEPANMSTIEQQSAKSIKCNDCGKLFKNHDEVECHAVKSGHENFSESTEEKKPLTEEEKKEQLAKIEAKLRQRRLDREAREKQEELEKEKNRIRSGKEMLEAKKKYEEQEMKKILDQRKREKDEEKLARQRVKEQIEQDRQARKAKSSGQPQETTVTKPVPISKPVTNYSEVKLQIRLTDGTSLIQTFQAKEPLSAVRLYIEMNRNDADGPFNLMTGFPKKVFTSGDYEKPLDTLGLAPSAVLIVSKAV